MKEISLSRDQQKLVEDNLGVVKIVIHKSILVNDNLYGFEYDDLFQEGCIWLCKAAACFDKGRNIKFSTFAEKVVANGLRTYCRLMRGKQKRYIAPPMKREPDEPEDYFEQLPAEDLLDRLIEEQDISLLLQKCKRKYAGTARLGIEAMEWKLKGLSGAEIAKLYHVKPNLVGAWISRAAQKLRQDADFMKNFDRTVEMKGTGVVKES